MVLALLISSYSMILVDVARVRGIGSQSIGCYRRGGLVGGKDCVVLRPICVSDRSHIYAGECNSHSHWKGRHGLKRHVGM